MLWLRLLTWLDKDAVAARLPREWLNIALAGGFVLAVILFLFLPGFWIALPVFVLVMLAELGVYLGLRSKQVGLKDLIADLKNMAIFKGSGKKSKVQEIPGAVMLATRDGRHVSQPDSDAPERQVYDVVQLMMTDPLAAGWSALSCFQLKAQFSCGSTGLTAWSTTARSSARAASPGRSHFSSVWRGWMLDEKRKPQMGTIQASIDGRRHEVQIHTAGSASGESLKLMVDAKNVMS